MIRTVERLIALTFRRGARLAATSFRNDVVAAFKGASSQFRFLLMKTFKGVISWLFSSIRALRCFIRACRMANRAIAFHVGGFFRVCFIVCAVQCPFTRITDPAQDASYASYATRESDVFAARRSCAFRATLNGSVAYGCIIMFIGSSSRVQSGFFRPFSGVQIGIDLRATGHIMVRGRTSTTDFLGGVRGLFAIARSMRRDYRHSRIRNGNKGRRWIKISAL